MRNRYKLIAAVALLSVTAGLPAGASAQKAKNVIFFLGDGMGPASVTATRIYGYGEAGRLNMETLAYTAKIKTYSADGQTTDSAPSMAAYMTGVKSRNEVISMSTETSPATVAGACEPTNGTPVPTFLEIAKAAGKAVGAITNTELTHATPAATYAHICNRNLMLAIAVQLVPGGAGYNTALADGVDVLMGGGRNWFTPRDPVANPNGRADGRDLVAEMQTHGYSYVTSVGQLRGLPANTTRLLGLFNDAGQMAYEADRLETAPTQPSLAEMTAKAIEVLKQADEGEGFFLMVEGGRIDHALHATQAKKVVIDTLAFDSAVKVAMEMTDPNDTLIIVTADHDHNMTINGYGQRGSGDHLLDVVRDPASGEPLVDADGFPYPTLVFGNGPNRPFVRTSADTFGLLDKNFLGIAAVRMSSETHGGGDIQLMAGGARSSLFRGVMENTSVFDLLLQATELTAPAN